MSRRVEPHAGGIMDTEYPYTAKRTVEGVVVCVLGARAARRGLDLTVHPSRAVLRGEIHELLITDDPDAAPLRIVDRVAYGACVEISRGGMILVHDLVTVDGVEIGEVVGFDETHLPNHMNVVLRASGPLRTGAELGLRLDQPVRFELGEAYRRARSSEAAADRS